MTEQQMDPKMLAAIQTRSMEQRTLDVLERIEALLKDAIAVLKAPPIIAKAMAEEAKKIEQTARQKMRTGPR